MGLGVLYVGMVLVMGLGLYLMMRVGVGAHRRRLEALAAKRGWRLVQNATGEVDFATKLPVFGPRGDFPTMYLLFGEVQGLRLVCGYCSHPRTRSHGRTDTVFCVMQMPGARLPSMSIQPKVLGALYEPPPDVEAPAFAARYAVESSAAKPDVAAALRPVTKLLEGLSHKPYIDADGDAFAVRVPAGLLSNSYVRLEETADLALALAHAWQAR